MFISHLGGIPWVASDELEVRPFQELGRGYQMGMFKWFVNPLDTVSDQWWSPRSGLGRSWHSDADVQTDVGPDRWAVEMRIPLKSLKAGDYAGKLKDGTHIVESPPPDGTIYRTWFKNGIGGAGQYVVLFDQHTWNTTTPLLWRLGEPKFVSPAEDWREVDDIRLQQIACSHI